MRIVKCRVGGYDDSKRIKGFMYCGRKFKDWPESLLANPFVIGQDGTRPEVIAQFRRWLFEQLIVGEEWAWKPWSDDSPTKEQERAVEIYDTVRSLPSNAILGCWCLDSTTAVEVQDCHCGVIARAARWLKSRDS